MSFKSSIKNHVTADDHTQKSINNNKIKDRMPKNAAQIVTEEKGIQYMKEVREETLTKKK